MDIAQAPPVDPRGQDPVKLVLLWAAAIGVALSLYVVAGYVWASAATAVLLAAMCWLTWRSLHSAPALTEAEAAGQAHGGGGGLSQEEIDAILPAFEYRRKDAAAEQCAVCISAVRDGETVRRMPACRHAFHAPCVDGWLRKRATCPMCRAEVVNVAFVPGKTTAVAEMV
ncbi:hypothetical protein EJB05_01842, partial [Eragrostis curvula]